MISQRSMMSALLFVVMGIVGAQPAAAQFFQISPTGAYLTTSPNDNPSSPLEVFLAALGSPTSLALTPEGLLQVAGPGSPQHPAVFCGIFSASSTILPATDPSRVSDAVASDASVSSPCITGSTFYPPNAATDVSQDFFIPNSGLTVDVPTGAQWLIIAVPDDYYADNLSPDPADYGIALTPIGATSAPEPGVLPLLATGLLGVGIVGVRRRKRVTAAFLRSKPREPEYPC